MLGTCHGDSMRTTSIEPTPIVIRNQYAIAYNYWRRPSATIAGHRGWMRMHGLLFTSDFLRAGIRHTRGWMDAETEFLAFREAIGRLVAALGDDVSFNEAQNEHEVIVPVLAARSDEHTSELQY